MNIATSKAAGKRAENVFVFGALSNTFKKV